MLRKCLKALALVTLTQGFLWFLFFMVKRGAEKLIGVPLQADTANLLAMYYTVAAFVLVPVAVAAVFNDE
jgi:hypothetical protein